MSSSEKDTPIFPTLDRLPRENLSAWKESLESAALAYCASLGPDGALGLACDAASWLARHAGVNRPRPVYPDPGILANAATPAERQAHATALLRYQEFSTAAARLRKLALASLGTTNTDAIRDANNRLHAVTANTIIASMDVLHGTYTEADINVFLEALKTKLKSVTGFDGHTAAFRKTLTQLALAGVPTGLYAAYRTYLTTLSPFPAFIVHIDNYVTTAPVANARNVTDLVTSLRVHLPTIETKSRSSPFGGAALHQPYLDGVLPDSQQPSSVDPTFGLTRNQLLAALSHLPKPKPGNDGNRNPGGGHVR